MKFAVIIPAAGQSTRFGGGKKQFRELAGVPLWLRSVELFRHRDDVTTIILAVGADDLSHFQELLSPLQDKVPVQAVLGGAERHNSVRNALGFVPEEVDFVAVHDAARPLTSPELIDSLFQAVQVHGAVIPGIPVADTLKRTDTQGKVTATVARTGLFQIQTPQVFRRKFLIDAHAKRSGTLTITDDAQLVEEQGIPVTVLPGEATNFKITTAQDLRLAEVYLFAARKEDGPADSVSRRLADE